MPYKIILVVFIYLSINFVNASNANALDSELSDGWQVSIDMDQFTIETNKSIDQNESKKDIDNFIVKNDNNPLKKAIISQISFNKIETFNNSSEGSYKPSAFDP